MTLSAIHNDILAIAVIRWVVCDIGGIWLCQLFTTPSNYPKAPTGCLWYRGDMTLSAIHNRLSTASQCAGVVCDIGGIWLCQLFTTPRAQNFLLARCLWYRGDMTLSAIHNAAALAVVATVVVCDIGGIWLCQLFTTSVFKLLDCLLLFVI